MTAVNRLHTHERISLRSAFCIKKVHRFKITMVLTVIHHVKIKHNRTSVNPYFDSIPFNK